jgi:uncharacterized protein
MKKNIWVFGAFIISIIGIFGFQYIKQNTKNNFPNITSNSITASDRSQSEPFYNLTIPYLRNRSYMSNLGSLEKVSSYSNHTSYTTSYQSDGLKVNGLLTIPNGDSPTGGWPAIVFVHGYIPPKQYQTLGQAYSAYVDYLANNKFVVFKIDLRGNGDSEGQGGGAYYSSDYIIDTLNAYSALESANFVNPKEIGLWGHSMAGNVVMRSFAAKPEIPAVVIWAGAGYTYTDLTQYGIQDNSYRPQPTGTPGEITRQNSRQKMRELYGDPSGGNPFWKQVAPTNYISDLKGAIELHHAVDDPTVNIGYSRTLNSLLDTTSVIHQFYEYPSGGHNISGTSFNLAMERTVEFFKKYLKN